METAANIFFDKDERLRKSVDIEKLKMLSAVFKRGGTVTAGNSSAPCDGAAVVLLASEKIVKQYQLMPKAKVLGYATIALAPELVFMAAIPAIKECLLKGSLTLEDIDLFEISEAFANQAIVTRDKLRIPSEKMNIWGGDLALGHPLGAAGTRVLVSLLHALVDQKKKRGVAAICLGGGGAVAVAIELVESRTRGM